MYHLEVSDVVKNLESDLVRGLNHEQVQERLQKHGLNELPQEERTSVFRLFIEQFDDTLVRILLLAAVVSAILGFTETHKHLLDAMIEPLVIMVVLVVNATISVRQTLSAEEAIEALKEYEPEMAKVLRQPCHSLQWIKANQLVPGDVVEVRVGDRVPADIRVCDIQSTILKADQSILTGESLSVSKTTAPVTIEKPVNQDKVNTLFSGTNIVAGRAIGIVVDTGLRTQIGLIRDNIATTEVAKTPLQVKLDEFGNHLSLVITIICVLVWVINIHHFDDPFHGNSWFKGAVYYFKIAISLAVAAIPEGLPAVITTCLAIGTRRMAKKNAIVRSLRSVETLGCTTVICSDKTGTITTNQMAVQKFCILDAAAAKGGTNEVAELVEFDVTGTSYDFRDGVVVNQSLLSPSQKATLEVVTHICCLCNDASLSYDMEKRSITRVGEATEAALLVFAEKLNIFEEKRNTDAPMSQQICCVAQRSANTYKKRLTLEFSRDRKRMSVYCDDTGTSDKSVLFVKGAPECVLENCSRMLVGEEVLPLTSSVRGRISRCMERLGTGRDTLRCLGLAMMDSPAPLSEVKNKDTAEFKELERDMIFVGLVGMLDPPRVEVHDALRRCADAGIRVIVITGDNKSTAEAICHRVGIFTEEEDARRYSCSARDFDNMTYQEKLKICLTARLFSRVEPRHKSEIVKCLQRLGEVTAMTGDGVNDAPALKAAEIGVAMGSGTAVAKSSSDIVLADDNFATIVSAVAEGRAIFLNTVQFISYLISSNIGEVVCIFITSVMGLPEGLIPVQLLWVNLITDGLPATALGFNPPPDDIMFIPPRDPKTPLIGTWQIIRYCVIGLYVGLSTVVASLWWYLYDPSGPSLTFRHLIYHQSCTASEPMYTDIDCELFNHFTPMTMSLSVLVFTEMFNACNSMSETQSIVRIPPWRNRFLVVAVITSMAIHMATLYLPLTQRLFSVAPLSLHQWQVVVLLSFPVIVLDELLKFTHRWYHSRGAKTPRKSKPE